MKKFVLAAVLAVVVGVAGAFFLFGGSGEDKVDAFLAQVAEIESGNEAYRETISFVPDIPEMSAEEIRSLEKERLPEAIAFFEKVSSELEVLKNKTPEGISLDMARALKEYCEIATAENKILAITGAYTLLHLEEFPKTEALKKSISATEKHLQIATLRLSQLEEINLMKRYE